MTELEKIAYAKAFIDKLANGINPLDDTPIPDDDISALAVHQRLGFRTADLLIGCRTAIRASNASKRQCER